MLASGDARKIFDLKLGFYAVRYNLINLLILTSESQKKSMHLFSEVWTHHWNRQGPPGFSPCIAILFKLDTWKVTLVDAILCNPKLGRSACILWKTSWLGSIIVKINNYIKIHPPWIQLDGSITYHCIKSDICGIWSQFHFGLESS